MAERRWTVWTCDCGRQFKSSKQLLLGACPECGLRPVRQIEVVPASQLSTLVEACEELIAELDGLSPDDATDPLKDRLSAVLHSLEEET